MPENPPDHTKAVSQTISSETQIQERKEADMWRANKMKDWKHTELEKKNRAGKWGRKWKKRHFKRMNLPSYITTTAQESNPSIRTSNNIVYNRHTHTHTCTNLQNLNKTTHTKFNKQVNRSQDNPLCFTSALVTDSAGACLCVFLCFCDRGV